MAATDTDLIRPGSEAVSPWAIPPRGWRDVALRTWREAGQDNISLIASGVAFCGVLAMVPLLGAIVLSYGLVATPDTVMAHVRALTDVMPADAVRLIGEQLANVVASSDGKKGFALVLALGIALYGTMKGAAAIVTALNIAYDEEETRSFVRLNLTVLAITVGAVLVAMLALLAVAAMASLGALFPGAPAVLLTLGKIASYLVMAGVAAAAAATLYRYGPDRHEARWMWLTPGSVLATVLWVAVTLGFGTYIANFGSYDATYGSLGAAIVLLTWLYLSATILLLGAEFNCELERQTARDTTRGPEQPMGRRQAHAADTVAGGGGTAAASSVSEDAPSGNGARVGHGVAAIITRAMPQGRVGPPPFLVTAIAAAGLALLRRRNRAIAGAALLALGGGLSWLGGRRAARGDAAPSRPAIADG